MNDVQFDDTLRRHLGRQPFAPFVVELVDGRSILIDQPTLVYGSGAATYGTQSQDLIFFNCVDVRAIIPAR